ncbi:hypothetical protein [Desulfohalovibrio reitneri]|uniref:hypothetical protein n=1 Tax=Desulfohalovibrio reitneri TaxID=1307759 RepID=UPI00068EC8F8|nr:hypothetical protein [Desulfohalovibrio reitneri]
MEHQSPDLSRLTEQALRLLERPRLRVPLLSAPAAPPSSLTDDLDRLAAPDFKPDGPFLLRLAAKYGHAYAHGSQFDSVDDDDLTLFLDRFANRRRGAESLRGKEGLRRDLLHSGFALCMLLDLPRTAHVLREVLNTPVSGPAPFLGLDIGAGSGILMAAMHGAARRNGFEHPECLGIERDPAVRERGDRLTRSLGLGRIVAGDAKLPETFAGMAGRRIAFVCNETLPSQGRRLWKEDFTAISAALLQALADETRGAAFFPAALTAEAGPRGRVRLTPANRFAPETDGYPLRLMRAEGIELDGRDMELSQVGKPYTGLVHPDWLLRLGRRW